MRSCTNCRWWEIEKSRCGLWLKCAADLGCDKYETREIYDMMDNTKLARLILDSYGADAQMGIAQEECAELIQAISKYKRAYNYANDPIKIREATQNLLEEIADVIVMTMQLKLIFPNGGIDDIVSEKLRRQMERIAHENR